jgi:hypothetical protein
VAHLMDMRSGVGRVFLVMAVTSVPKCSMPYTWPMAMHSRPATMNSVTSAGGGRGRGGGDGAHKHGKPGTARPGTARPGTAVGPAGVANVVVCALAGRAVYGKREGVWVSGWRTTSERVEHVEPVHPGACDEEQTDDAHAEADDGSLGGLREGGQEVGVVEGGDDRLNLRGGG